MIRRLLLTSAVLALAACGAQQPAAPRAPPPASTPSAAATLSREGLGPVRIRMTAAEVAALWGEDADTGAVGGPDPATCDEFHPVRAPQGVNVMIQDGVLTRISLVRDSPVKAEHGLGLGDTAEAVRAAYRGGLVARPHKYEPAPAEDLIIGGRGGDQPQATEYRAIRYEIGTDGRVKIIHAGTAAVELVEGCA